METERTDARLPVGAAGGTRVAGRYELLAILGTGGTGVVYRARDHELGEEVAIKILPPMKSGETDTARLKREIVAARKITHPNVIRLHEFGLSDKEGYLSMEILPGGSLAERIARGTIPVDEALRIGIGVCEGLGAAHAEGIMHRDVKPQNVLFDKAGRPKIVDFGLARGMETTSNTIGFSGTPQYMSPESADGGDITFRSDVYSLGVMLFEIFTGRRPFLAPSLGRLVVMHTKEAPPPPRSIRPEVPPDVEAVILRALEKNPEKRTDGAQQIAEILRRVQGTVAPHDAGADALLPPRPRVTTDPQPATLVRGTLPSQRRRGLMAGLSAAGVLVLALGGLAAREAGKSADETPIPSIATSAPPVVATPSATATPVATVVAVATRAVVRSTPTPAPVVKKPGSLLVKSTGTWVKVVVDGKVVDESTPMPAAIPIPAGAHRVQLVNKAASFSHDVTVDVKAGKQLTIFVEPLAGRVRVE